MPRHVVGRLSEIPPGSRKIVRVGKREIGIFNVDGELFALRNRCPHQGGPLCAGAVLSLVECRAPGEYVHHPNGKLLRCPWHGWEFDLRTGQSWFDPTGLRVRSYETSIEPGTALAAAMEAAPRQKGPYVAETYPVSVNEDYVLVHLPD